MDSGKGKRPAMTKTTGFRVVVCLFLGFAPGPACIGGGEDAPSRSVYAGGVAGVESLADPEASAVFRELGGGLYLHNNGWARLSGAQQREVVRIFAGNPVAIELGFKEGAQAWANRLRDGYLALGLKPRFIAANAFAGNHRFDLDEWKRYTETLRSVGLPASTRILPTFEYANFRANLETLGDNTVRKRPDFQALIRYSGGLVLDVPPGYAFNREEAYRSWVVDAADWTRSRGLEVVWITSPHVFHDRFRSDTRKFLRFLQEHDAEPTVIVVENYNPRAPEDYPNVVGSETDEQSTLGVGLALLKEWAPVRKPEGAPDRP